MSKTLKEAQDLLIEINKTVAKLDESIKIKSFDILYAIAFSEKRLTLPKPRMQDPLDHTHDQGDEGLGDFVGSHETDKPSENVKVLVAWIYSQYGKVAISIDELKKLSVETGLTVPDRIDMTLKGSKKDGKSLFNSVKKGHYQLTTTGELFMKDTYSVKKGKKVRPVEDDS